MGFMLCPCRDDRRNFRYYSLPRPDKFGTQVAIVPNFAFLPAIPSKERLFSVGLYTMVPRWNPVLLGKTLPILQTALQMCLAIGGRSYLYGFNEMDDLTKQKFYGADYTRLAELRQGGDWLNPTSL